MSKFFIFVSGDNNERGFFSYVNHVIRNIANTDPEDKVFVDFNKTTLYYDSKIQSTNNVWEYYFEQLTDLSIEEIKSKYQYEIYTFYGNKIVFDIGKINENDRYLMNESLKKIKIKSHILKKVDEFVESHFKEYSVLGVHKRGTDHGLHGQLLSIDKYFQEVDIELSNNNYQKIFLATDENSTLKAFRERYGDLIINYDSIKSDSDKAVFIGNRQDIYKLGEDILVESILLSKCNFLIRTFSNVSLFSLVYNIDLKYKDIDNIP